MQVHKFILGIIMYYATGVLRTNVWFPYLGGCIKVDLSRKNVWFIYTPLIFLIPSMIIVITTVSTFLFTRGFLRKNLKRHQRTLNEENFVAQKNIYSARIKNLIGIFGALLISNFLFLFPFVIVVAVTEAVGFYKIPKEVATAIFVLLLFNNVIHPGIQVFFRKDLTLILKKFFQKLQLMDNPNRKTSSLH